MILFNHMRLAEKLGRSELTETTKFYYYLALLVIFSTFGGNPPLSLLYTSNELTIYDQLYVAIPHGTAIIFATIVFRIHASVSNYDFITRMVCLSVPIWLQASLLNILLYLVIAFINRRLQVSILETLPTTDGVDVAVCTAVALYIGGQFIRAIRRAAIQGTENSSMPT
jgi:hypothetical protein